MPTKTVKTLTGARGQFWANSLPAAINGSYGYQRELNSGSLGASPLKIPGYGSLSGAAPKSNGLLLVRYIPPLQKISYEFVDDFISYQGKFSEFSLLHRNFPDPDPDRDDFQN